MGLSIQIATHASLVLGYGLLLLLAFRSRAGRERARQLLETVLLLAALWTLGLGLLRLLTSGSWWEFVWHRAAQVGLVILAMHTANFADVFAQRPPRRRLRIGIVALLVLIAIVLDALASSLAIHVSPIPSIRLGSSELATLLLFSSWLFASGTAWWTCVVAFRHASGAKHRNRIRYLGAALVSFAVGDLLILIDGTSDVHIGLATRLIGFSIATFSVLRYDLPDIRRLTLTGVRVTLLSGLTACLYLAGLLAATYVSGALPDLSQPLTVGLAVGLALLIVAIVDVTLGPRLHRILDRAILGERYNIQRALRLYSDQVNLILDLERLADTTLDWIRTSLGVERSAFILFTALRHGRTQLRVLRSTRPPLPPPQAFAPDSRFVTHFHKIGRPLSQYDLDMLSWFQSMPEIEHAWLKALGVDLYVPILAPDRCVALLALGPKASEQPYSDEDMETLMILAGQTGTALENARLLDDLRAVQGDLHRLSTELAETNRQLQRLDQTKTDFITIASHELRTPLTQISGYSEILAKLQADELGDARAVRDFIDGISNGALRLKQVVDAMVDVSLIETSALKLRPTTLALDPFVRDAIDKVRPAITARSQTLTLGDLSSLPDIQADRDRFEQVLVSLLTNAIKFTPDGGEIAISGQIIQSGSEKGFVELKIADSGIGVDPEHQNLIFEKFYRPENPMLHSTDARGFKGAGPGLGLAIAKGIVTAHGGRIWVESPGRDEEACPGSTFHIRLPATASGKE